LRARIGGEGAAVPSDKFLVFRRPRFIDSLADKCKRLFPL
jgi:hypothetical protein